jgi:hypothetical protein
VISQDKSDAQLLYARGEVYRLRAGKDDQQQALESLSGATTRAVCRDLVAPRLSFFPRLLPKAENVVKTALIKGRFGRTGSTWLLPGH